MDESTPSADTLAQHLADAAKAIGELETLVTNLMAYLPKAKPWQRELRTHLGEADRLLQVLRMTISMDRDQAEIAQAAADLLARLRLANVFVGGGRADMGTKHAVQLGFSFGQRIVAGIGAQAATG